MILNFKKFNIILESWISKSSRLYDLKLFKKKHCQRSDNNI